MRLIKEGELKTNLLPHQQRVVDKIQKPDQPGLLVVHGLGSGKTLTSIAAQDALKMPATVVVPAALQENYAKERKKHLTGTLQPAHIESLQNAAVKGQVTPSKMLIVDEAHRARDPSSKTHKALATSEAEKRILLTGSPFYNHPGDIAPLLNLAAGEKVLPSDRGEFSKRYIKENLIQPGFFQRLRGTKPGMVEGLNQKMAPELQEKFKKWVDYHPGSTDNFPAVTHEDVHVPMTKKQLEMYDSMMDRAPPWVARKIKAGLPPSKQESKDLNAFLGAVRQVANTTAPFHSTDTVAEDPKIQAAYESLKKQLDENPRAKGVVYSNFLGAGINPYKERLIKANIPYGEFTGEMPKAQRDSLVKDYNEDKIRALLLSSAGGEGLDLKGTRLLQILDPHWNEERGNQVEGRAVRFGSHANLPSKEQKVLIQRYLSTRPRVGLLEGLHLKEPGGSVDEYLTQRSAEKAHLIKEFKNLLPA